MRSPARTTWSRGIAAATACLTLTCLALTSFTLTSYTLTAAAGGPAAGADASVQARHQAGPKPAPQLHVSGNELVNQHGQRVVLHGVNRSGGDWACMLNIGIWDGPMNQASITAIKSWDVNAVRVPLNEACWNGESYADPLDSGAAYRSAVRAYVQSLNRSGLVAILDLHITDGYYDGPSSDGCRTKQATCQKPMPDAAQAIPFWRSVARMFRGDNAVIFDLFNEPFPGATSSGSATAWSCWQQGGGACRRAGIRYQVAGMQTLVNVVRSTGARNVLMLAGTGWANDLTGWLAYEPHDPDHNLAASWHSYGQQNTCDTQACWDSQIAPVIATVPVIAGEIGATDSYIGPLMRWLDAKSAGYLAWAWNTKGNFYSGPSLITSYAGTPTSYGAGYRDHLRSLSTR